MTSVQAASLHLGRLSQGGGKYTNTATRLGGLCGILHLLPSPLLLPSPPLSSPLLSSLPLPSLPPFPQSVSGIGGVFCSAAHLFLPGPRGEQFRGNDTEEESRENVLRTLIAGPQLCTLSL